VERAGITYRFVADAYGPTLGGWQHPWQLYREVRRLVELNHQAAIPTVIHFNGLLFPLQLGLLHRWLPATCPIVVQHHAERPWPARSHFLQRWGLKAAKAFLFAARPLAAPWLEAGLINPNQPIYRPGADRPDRSANPALDRQSQPPQGPFNRLDRLRAFLRAISGGPALHGLSS
jgi:hypothetical protein